MQINMEYINGILFVRLDGILTRPTSYKINNYLIPVILKHKIKYLVYNLYNIKEIDSFGLDALLNTKSAIEENKGLIYLCEVNRNILKTVNKSHINKCENELCALKVIEV